MTAWHYTANTMSYGPYGFEEMRSLFSNGTITSDTMVWDGETEWRRLADEPRLKGISMAVAPSSSINDVWAWLMAAVPIFGFVIESVLLSDAGFEPSFLMRLAAYIGVYVFLGYLDSKSLEESGREGDVTTSVLVPVYLYKRSRRLEKPQYPLALWITAFVVTIFLASGNFRAPFQFAANLPTCDDAVSIGQIKQLFPRIPLNLANIPALDLKNIKTVSSSNDLVSCRATVIAQGGTEMNVTYTITPQDGQFLYALNLAL